MRIGELLDNLGLLDTGADALARETLEAFSKRDDFVKCREDTLELMGWILNGFADLIKRHEQAELSAHIIQERFDDVEKQRAFLAAL
jgi:hypothetical protein